jgi:hypothetical protein
MSCEYPVVGCEGSSVSYRLSGDLNHLSAQSGGLKLTAEKKQTLLDQNRAGHI